MWTKITNENVSLVDVGTLICQNHPNIETMRPLNAETLETIYEVEIIDGTGDIILKTDNLINITEFPAKRKVTRKKLKDEKWFIWTEL